MDKTQKKVHRSKDVDEEWQKINKLLGKYTPTKKQWASWGADDFPKRDSNQLSIKECDSVKVDK
jgi:inhibitor of KinA sporulation pathway (predicted exonuclease)